VLRLVKVGHLLSSLFRIAFIWHIAADLSSSYKRRVYTLKEEFDYNVLFHVLVKILLLNACILVENFGMLCIHIYLSRSCDEIQTSGI
jgi:hypothetical protein